MLQRIFPFLAWFKGYSLPFMRADFVSGLTVALVLIPQSMAYAQLAGLPAYYGLYAAFLPPLVASLFGSSRQLATGPVAVVSLMTATALEPIATAGSEAYIAYAILLALLVGIFQFLLGLFRLGLVVNFLSHPVVNGFTNAAAIIIATSQLSKLFGVNVDKAEHHYMTVYNVVEAALAHTHWPTLVLAILAFAIMIGLKRMSPKIPYVLVAVIITTIISWAIGFEHNYNTAGENLLCERTKELIQDYNGALTDIKLRSQKRLLLRDELDSMKQEYSEDSPHILNLQHQISLLNVEINELKEKVKHDRSLLRESFFKASENPDGSLVFCNTENLLPQREYGHRDWQLKVGNGKLDMSSLTFVGGGAVVGKIPAGLPGFKKPQLDFKVMIDLFPMAVIISLLGFMEAISIAKAMAARTGQRLDPNQELIGQGAANIVGCFGQSYAVSGSFSRSAVNLQSGAVSGLSSVISSIFVMITLLLFTPLLYHLPQSVLAAIIMMAVIGLINVSGFIHSWKAQKYDGVISIITFVCTLAFAPHLDKGILIGVGLSLILFLLRGMRPNIAMLSKHPDGTYRNLERFGLAQCRHIAVIRYNGSLYFASVNYLERQVLDVVACMPELRHVLIVGNGINELDASGEDMLSHLTDRLREAGYDLSISGLNDHVLDTMRRTYLYYKIGEDHLFRNADRAIAAIHASAHKDSSERKCPLLEVVYGNK
ncbi:MAG TPA: STAS domain-containing protein [candidate division Zixibacteria bacterium]|nr:STAS domain-containing protein [candidate division Zixibacteria bacterium]HEQ98252.1 STAS domain-containing protein [candidate division Zixibacteria bacterium]